MEVRAYLKGARLSPQKACLIADMVRGLDVEKALNVLTFSKQKGASLVKKLLDSAISNAENNENADIDNLKIKSIIVNKGLVMKRIKIRARGRSRLELGVIESWAGFCFSFFFANSALEIREKKFSFH